MQRLGGRLLKSEIHLRKDQDWLSLQRLVYLYSCEKSLQCNQKILLQDNTWLAPRCVSFSFPPKDDGTAKGQESEDSGRRLDVEGWYLKHVRFVFMFVCVPCECSVCRDQGGALHPGTGITEWCVGAGYQTHVLQKSTQCSEPLRNLSSPFVNV